MHQPLVYTVTAHPSGYFCGGLSMGLSKPGNLKKPKSPRGSNGLTNHGRLIVLDGCALLTRYYPNQLSFLTWTFPPEYVSQVKQNWAALVRLLLLKLVYWLKKLRLPTHYVGVTELQKNGNPHLHLVFVGRRSRSGSWLITPSLLDKILFEAVENFCVDCDRTRFKSAGRVEPVRSDAGRYLAKYLSKGNHNKPLHRTPQNDLVIAASSESAGELHRCDGERTAQNSAVAWHPPTWYFCDRGLRKGIANSLVRFHLRVTCWATIHDLFSETGGYFNLVVREHIPVGFVAFTLPNLVEWLTVKLCGGQ